MYNRQKEIERQRKEIEKLQKDILKKQKKLARRQKIIEGIQSVIQGKQLGMLFDDFIIRYKNYKLINIVINAFGASVLIALVLQTEKEKEYFCLNDFDKCVKDLTDEINNSNIVEITNYDYMVLSQEEVDKKYEGSYYYAMH